jgi:predicted transcriptional regulator
MDEAQLDSLLKKLAVYLANELDKRSDLLSRLEDLEDTISRENFSEDDIREWISDAINNAEINVDISA